MTNTLYDEFIQIFGSYTPVLVQDANTGNFIDCVNFAYIGSVLFALVVCYGVLRIIGNMLKR